MKAKKAIRLCLEAGVPLESLALYGRWWQAEVWLRQLAYMVLRSAWGQTWETEISKRAQQYAKNDNLIHLFGPDQVDLLGYLDFSLLLNLITDNWNLFQPFLLDTVVWNGRAAELKSIRNRVGHLRRSSPGDRSRIEQTLRDLEPGFKEALKALASIDIDDLDPRSGDPVIDDFKTGRLGAACSHVKAKYSLDVNLGLSSMPWSAVPASPLPVSGTAGLIWHLDIGGPDRYLLLNRLADMLAPIRENVVYMFASTPAGAQIAVPAVDDANVIINTLYQFVSHYSSCTMPATRFSVKDVEAWPGDISGLDSRILVEHLFAIAPSAASPGSSFGV